MLIWRIIYLTMSAEKISLQNASENKLFYFVANAVVYREEDKKCLILKRDEREKVHPGKYAVVGGKLEWGDLDINNPSRNNGAVLDYDNAVEKLLHREVFEEAGIEIHPELHYLNSVAFIRPDGIPVIMVKFAAMYKSGDVIPEQGGFTDYAWVDGQEVLLYDCIDGIQEEVKDTLAIFRDK